MAREESDREDLLREATALVERAEIMATFPQGDGSADESERAHIVAGFRSNDALSIYFGYDPVYQFNAAGELRRAFVDGLLYKAARGRLVSIRRVRTEDEVQLVMSPLSPLEEAAFLERMLEQLKMLLRILDAGSFDVVGQVSTNSDVLGRLRDWLTRHDAITIAMRPNA